jgi:hypothetical protein
MTHNHLIRALHNPIAIAMAILLLVTFIGLPTIISSLRRLPDKRRIMALNLVGIVAFTGWFAALTWAILGRQDRSLYDAVMQKRWARPVLTIGLAVVVGGGAWATLSALR